MIIPTLQDAILSAEGGVALLTFTRDDVRNALTGTGLINDIETTIQWVNKNLNISALIITGEGSAFSAGGNIKDMQNRAGDFGGDVRELEQKYREGIQRIPLAIESCEVPIIAAINGAAIGAGFDLTCMCDMRIASEQAKLGETFINLGIIPGDGGAWYLQKLVGYQRAAELTFTGRVFDAQEALTLGLILEITTEEQLLVKAKALAAEIASKPSHAVRYTKRLMKKAQRMQLNDFLDTCAGFQGISHNTQDHLEAVNAFIEKRPASYTGE